MFVAGNEAYIDWWLLNKFPGKTLEELDNVDWLRLQRAMEVDRIVEAEQRRNAYYLKLFPRPEREIEPSDAVMWAHHDKLIGEESDY